MRKSAVYCATRNIYEDIIPSLKALLVNSDVERVYLLIEDDKFPYQVPDCVEAINVSGQKLFPRGGPNWNVKWTWMTLIKAALPKLFLDLDRILNIDPDAVAIEDISDIWNIDVEGKYFAAVREPSKSSKDRCYVNFGVCLYNLEELRNSGMIDRVISELNRRRFTFVEQDCFNEMCQDGIVLMPAEYNSSKWTEKSEHPRIMHYSAVKGWQSLPVVQKYREMPWSVVNEIHDTRMSKKDMVC